MSGSTKAEVGRGEAGGPSAELDQLLRAFAPEVRSLVLRTRQLILDSFPGAMERVNPGWKVISFGRGPGPSQQVCAISPQRASVYLEFARGGTLPDPEGLLVGKGKGTRHVKIKDAERLASPALPALIGAAVDAVPR